MLSRGRYEQSLAHSDGPLEGQSMHAKSWCSVNKETRAQFENSNILSEGHQGLEACISGWLARLAGQVGRWVGGWMGRVAGCVGASISPVQRQPCRQQTDENHGNV